MLVVSFSENVCVYGRCSFVRVSSQKASACNNQEDWKYYIAVASLVDTPVGMEDCIIPAFTWAVFSGEGVGTSIQDLERRIVMDWLPTSGYEYADGPDMEVYLNADLVNMKYEVWIPVVRK